MFFEGRLYACLFRKLIHADAHMALIVHAFSVPDHQHLRRFVVYGKKFCHLVGKVAVRDQVEIIEIDGSRGIGALETIKHHAADAATGTVFENNLWHGSRFFFDLPELFFGGEGDPVHAALYLFNKPAGFFVRALLPEIFRVRGWTSFPGRSAGTEYCRSYCDGKEQKDNLFHACCLNNR